MAPKLFKPIILSWISSIAIDFFLNAGVFSSYFNSTSQFILSPSESFLRIPAGYASILLLVFILVLLIYRGAETTITQAMQVGAIYAVAVSSSPVLGLWSITKLPAAFLTVWFVDQFVELMVAGLIVSLVRYSSSRHIARIVLIEVAACFAGGIILQNILG